MSKEKIIGFGLLFLGIVLIVTVYFSFDSKMSKQQVVINGHELEVYIAQTSTEQRSGLANINLDDFDVDGMLFIFEDCQERGFWMNEMNFDLDIIWIRDNEILKIERGIPFPNDGEVRYMYSEPFEVDMVLELPLGILDEYSMEVGQSVNFK